MNILLSIRTPDVWDRGNAGGETRCIGTREMVCHGNKGRPWVHGEKEEEEAVESPW